MSIQQNHRHVEYAIGITRRCGREYEKPLNSLNMRLRLGLDRHITEIISHNILYSIERAAYDQVLDEALKKSPERFQEDQH